ARRPVWPGRRHVVAVGRGRFTPVRAGDRAADITVGARDLSRTQAELRLHVQHQSIVPHITGRTGMDFAARLCHQPGAGRTHGRELPIGTDLATHAVMSIRTRRIASGRLHRWVAPEPRATVLKPNMPLARYGVSLPTQ